MKQEKQLTTAALHRDLRKQADRARAKFLLRFFKTGPGEYAEGDQFFGLTVPQQRLLVRQYRAMPVREVKKALHSKIHDERAIALLILVWQYPRSNAHSQKAIFDLYLRSTRHINNWDLVDCSAEHIVGPHLAGGSRKLLDRLARSNILWERRIAMLSTFYYIRRSEFADTLRIARILLRDEHDLIHKAVGWMLREVGKRDHAVEERFLKKYAHVMPRTMLRYAIEKFPESQRQAYLKKPRNP